MNVAIIWANALFAAAIYLATGYVVFFLGHSPWWFVAAFAVSMAETQYIKRNRVGALSSTEVGK